MRTIRTKVYKFAELSNDAKEKAIENFYGLNVDYNWWQFTYEDAKNIGLKLDGFDLDRNLHADGKFISSISAYECAEKIICEHGERCETHKTAKEFISNYDNLVEKYSDGLKKDVVKEGNEWDFDNDVEELESDFLKSLLSDYAQMLQNEYEYLTSSKAIIETIEANEYEFTKDGNRF